MRQGCPLSPCLFLVIVEMLATKIRENKNITGLHIGDSEIKSSQLADDTVIYTDNFNSIKYIIGELEEFYNITALKLNKDKTMAHYIGSLKNRQIYPFGLDWSKKIISTLGIDISGDELDHYNYNFKPRIKKIFKFLTFGDKENCH